MSAPIDGDDLQSLARQLAYGSPATRQRLVEGLLSRGDFRIWALLVDTVRSGEPWSLRVRCLEVLGLAATRADQQTAERILTALLAAG